MLGAAALTIVLFSIAVFAINRLMQEAWAYEKVSTWIKTYEVERHDDGSWEAIKVQRPFTHPTNDNYLSWDAEHYNQIRQYLYDPTRSWHGNFAFFPLFPLLWRTLNASPLGIATINWLLWIVGIVLLILTFGKRGSPTAAMLMFCAPMLVVFMIPYSEALFFACASLGIFGFSKKCYPLYFIGFMLAACTRAAGNLLIVAWLVTDIIIALRNKETFSVTAKRTLLHLLPIVAGVAAVIIFQKIRGAEHWFQYVIAQREWGKSLSWPSWPLSDWSDEGKSITHPLLYGLFIPAIAWLAVQVFNPAKTDVDSPHSRHYQLRLLCVLIFVGNIVLALFTQHGSMYSQARLLTCTPFFFYLVLDFSTTKIERRWLILLSAFLLIAISVCFKMFFKADSLGYLITIAFIVLVFIAQRLNKTALTVAISMLLLLNAWWTAYLVNCFVNGGWIFT
ncbi:MAG: hypothetical protein IJ761_03605 [Bacteroidales bacterium]|nr:hypothetical protein [Bacteroidales bacterium]